MDGEAGKNARRRSLIDGVLDLGPPPCEDDGGCRYWNLCATEKMACEQLRAYISKDVRRTDKPRARIPMVHIYESIYCEDDD